MKIKERIEHILTALNTNLYEKEAETGMSLLAALAGESVLLLGPPGVAKSMIARRLKLAFQGAEAFEYLMSRFSTPDEIFGPVSIARLKESDTYERAVNGYLPTADIVFLDEIWKAGPAIQNTLLTVINEKMFRNGKTIIQLPLKLLIGASNELPTEGEGLEALWDRFLVRMVSQSITHEQNFRRMMLDEDETQTNTVKIPQPITPLEYEAWAGEIDAVGCETEVLDAISVIRRQLLSIPVEDSNLPHNVYVSDRRWKKIMRLLKTSAFIHERDKVNVSDILPIWRCLWNEPVEQEPVRMAVIRSLFASMDKEITRITQGLRNESRLYQVNACLKRLESKNDQDYQRLKICNGYYYHVMGHGTGNTYIFMVDYHSMSTNTFTSSAKDAVLYVDPKHPDMTILRTCSAGDATETLIEERVKVYRDDKYIYINGVRYNMEELKKGEVNNLKTVIGDSRGNGADLYAKDINKLVEDFNRVLLSLKDNIFLSEKDLKDIDEYANTLRKRFAYIRIDIEKLYSYEC